MARKTRKDAALTRQNIISAGARVFCRDGIAGATLEAIAQEAGVTRGAIYWHFKGKQGLLQALLSKQPLPFERAIPSGIAFMPGWELLCQALEETMNDDISRRLSRIMLHKSERVAGHDPVASRLQEIRSSFIGQLRPGPTNRIHIEPVEKKATPACLNRSHPNTPTDRLSS